MDKWYGKTAVITGGCSGMGAAILAKFVEHGLRVINLDVSVAENGTSHDGKVFNRKCNVASLESIRENFAWIEEQFGVIHVLINCAGIVAVNPIIDPREENTAKVDNVLDVNLRGTIHCTREAMKLMVKSDDYCLIVNLCSIFGHIQPYLGYSLGVYHTTKHAIRAFSETIRQELCTCKSEKIRVSNVSPGGVRTNMISGTGMSEKQLAAMKFVEADEVADTVMFLFMSPYNVNITELTIRPVGECA
jgi:NAD(P)-dependent dehydrogenase (short-subunit alcohol dehydrogenase family)